MIAGIGIILTLGAIAVIVTIAFVPAGPSATLGFAALLMGAGAIFTFASGPAGSPSPIGVAFVIGALGVGVVGLGRDATERKRTRGAAQHDRSS